MGWIARAGEEHRWEVSTSRAILCRMMAKVLAIDEKGECITPLVGYASSGMYAPSCF